MKKKRYRDKILCIRNVCFIFNVSKVKRLMKFFGNENVIKGNGDLIEYVNILKRSFLDFLFRYVGDILLGRYI